MRVSRRGSGAKTSALGFPCSNTIIFTETQCTVAPPGSGVTSAATVAVVTAVEPAAELSTMLGGQIVACRFALEEEVVSDVEGVWVDGMGAVETELGGVLLLLLIDVADVNDTGFLEPEE